MNNDSLIAIFQNVRQVIRADQLCRAAGINATVVPVPERYSSECGMCLRFAAHSEDAFVALMNIHEIYPKIYE